MKIFFIDANNNTAQVNYPLLEQFILKGMDVIYFTSFNRWDSDYYESNYGVNSKYIFFILPNKVASQKLRRILKGAFYLIDLIRFFLIILFNRPEIIHVNNITIAPIDYYFYKSLRIFNIKLILTQHNYKEHEKNTVPKYKLKCFDEFDTIICLSEFTKNEFPDKFHRKIIVLPHGNVYKKEIANYGANANKIASKHKSVNLLFFGLIRPYKGIELLIDAIRNMENTNFKNINLRIVGNALDNSYLQNLRTRSESDSNILIVNKFMDYEEILNEITRSDIGILPYITATQSGVPYLYAAMNTPLLITNVGGLPEQVDLRFSEVCEPNKESLIKGLNTLIKRLDEKEIDLSSFRKFNIENEIDTVADKYIKLYHKILAHK